MKRSFILAGAMLSLIGLPDARGQSIKPSTLNATGGTATVAGNIYDWSVGEMTMVSTFSGASVIVTQGLLQPEMMPSGAAGVQLAQRLEVFPNPASSQVNLRLSADIGGKLTYRLLDLTGKELKNQSAQVKQGITIEQIDITALAAATYMLEVSFTDKNDKTATTSYKIEKLK